MNLFKMFNREKSIPVSKVTFEPFAKSGEEILLVEKYKNNKYGNEARDLLFERLKTITNSTNIKFRKVRFNTKIDHYEKDTFDLVSGFFKQIHNMIKDQEVIIGELIVKACDDDIEIHLSYIQGNSIKEFINRKFKNDFGNWQFYEKNGVCVSAFFSKSAFLKKKDIKRVQNERGIYV